MDDYMDRLDRYAEDIRRDARDYGTRVCDTCRERVTEWVCQTVDGWDITECEDCREVRLYEVMHAELREGAL